jgi:choline monooxygenase
MPGLSRAYSNRSWSTADLGGLLSTFDPAPAVDHARTPPGSWYTHPAFLAAEADSVFQHNWLHVGRTDQLTKPGAFFTGSVLGQPFIVTRTDAGEIRAMFNVCAHHAAIVVNETEGCTDRFTCPYHGWCYKNDGRLWKAQRMKGVKDFKARDNGLKPIQVDILEPFVFINFSPVPLPSVREVLSETVAGPLEGFGRKEHLKFVRRVAYDLPSNWKVFCDNYLDGGYHVAVAHPALASGLKNSSYKVEGVKNGTVQSVCTQKAENVQKDSSHNGPSRLGSSATYSFAYPNFMVNRYGPWMDTNTAIPTNSDTTSVVFDYFLDVEQVRQEDPDVDIEKFISESLEASDQVQLEDEHLCRIVQQGLASRGYSAGRYSPDLEHGMHAFHRQIHADLSQLLPTVA